MCRANFLANKHSVNPLNMLMHLQLLCAQRGKELGFSGRVEKQQQTIESSFMISQRMSIQSIAPSATVWP